MDELINKRLKDKKQIFSKLPASKLIRKKKIVKNCNL